MAGDAEFAAKLASLVPAGRIRDTSAVRQRIRATFDSISSARDIGVTWQQIADLMVADGVLTADGTSPTANELRALYHLEKYARGGKRKRRPSISIRRAQKAETAPQVSPAQTAPSPAGSIPPSPSAQPLPVLEEEPPPTQPAEPMFRPAKIRK
jgi:hypothetical protein